MKTVHYIRLTTEGDGSGKPAGLLAEFRTFHVPEMPANWQEVTNAQLLEKQAELDAWKAAQPIPPPPVPQRVTQRQLRLWLLSIGVNDAMIRAQLEAIADPAQREAALIEYDYATEYRRNHPLVAQMAAALGLTTEQIDNGFRTAVTL